MKITLISHIKHENNTNITQSPDTYIFIRYLPLLRVNILMKTKIIVYRKTDGLEVDCYVLLFLKVC